MPLSSIEIATSFHAPLLKLSGPFTSSTIDFLLDDIGSTKVRFGEVVDDANPDNVRLALTFGPEGAVGKLNYSKGLVEGARPVLWNALIRI